MQNFTMYPTKKLRPLFFDYLLSVLKDKKRLILFFISLCLGITSALAQVVCPSITCPADITV